MTALATTRMSRALRSAVWACLTALVLAALGACSSTPPARSAWPQSSATPTARADRATSSPVRNDIALYALSLLDSRYTWGGKGPATGFDCSGLVTHVYREAAGIKVSGNAVTLGQTSRQIDVAQMQPGDLVFFNTLGTRHSHVGVYIGNGRFVHASNPRTGVRVDQLSNRYFAQRFEGVHTLLD